MKMKLFIGSILFILSFSVDAQTWQWAVKAGGPANDSSNGLAVDNSGNSFVSGTFYDSISFGSTVLTNIGTWSVYIAKYDINGSLLWAKIVASDSAISVRDICLDYLGNINIVGHYFATASFGSHMPVILTSVGDFDVFIAKLNVTGDLLWAHSLGESGIDYAGGISSDVNGNLYITGDLHLSSFPYSSSKIFVAKYDSTGNNLWMSSELNYGNNHFGNSISTDIAGNSYITGEFFNSLIFDSSLIVNTGNIESNIIIAKFDPNGNMLWGKSAGAASGYCGSKSICIDQAGNSFITGYYHGTILFDTISITATSGLNYDVFVAKCSNNGNFTWVNKSVGPGNSHFIHLDGQNNIYIGGTFPQSITFGSTTLTSSGNNDIYIADYDSTGNFIMANSFGGPSNDNIGGIAINSNQLFVSGTYIDTIFFGPSVNLISDSSFHTDLFLARMNSLNAINELSAGNEIKYFPNPAKSSVTVKCSLDIESIMIQDITGKMVSNILTGKERLFSMDTKNLPNGIYLIQIKTRQQIFTRKLIIQK